MFGFSVLMSVYIKETADNLHDSLESIVSNTFPPSEIVIVFDGPVSNEVEKLVNDYSKRYVIKIIRLSTNMGLGNALNAGLRHCAYEWVFRMDSDDICVNNRFELQIKEIIKDDELDIIGGVIQEFNSDMKNSIGFRYVPLDNESIHIKCKTRCPFNHMTVGFKKEKILKVGGYLHHEMMEDYNLWVRLLSDNIKAKNINDVLVNVRAGDSMISRRRGVRYSVSEFKLAKLKIYHGLQSHICAYAVFIGRASLRLLPVTILKSVYKKLR
ncbi:MULTISPECIES: glycosyltransferase [Pantoea]|uniref:glycosyltransferase n=1 Tax=Pantoea TaxID=53335 RepID=UPI0008FD217E|nr:MULTISPECIES: glycosyltransferase [unclassified Pantoea]